MLFLHGRQDALEVLQERPEGLPGLEVMNPRKPPLEHRSVALEGRYDFDVDDDVPVKEVEERDLLGIYQSRPRLSSWSVPKYS